jgi:hypothetical protein
MGWKVIRVTALMEQDKLIEMITAAISENDNAIYG